MSEHSLCVNRPREGFTLVELLVVIGIIGVLAGLLVPTIMIGKEKANELACKNNLKEIGTLAGVYADEHNGWYFYASVPNAPSYQSFQAFMDWNTDLNPRLLTCPSCEDPAAVRDEAKKTLLEPSNVSYTWVSRKMKNTIGTDQALSSDDCILGESGSREGHKRGMNVLFGDGHVEFIAIDALPPSKLPEGLVGSGAPSK